MNPHERVRHLLALATNAGASLDEARNASLAAVKLIVEHKMLEIVPPPPVAGRPMPSGPFGAIFAGLTIDTLLNNVGVMAAGAASVEALELKNRNAVLERQVARMQTEIARLNGELVQKADIPRPHHERPRRRRRG